MTEPNPREPPEELIRLRAKKATELRKKWEKAAYESLKKEIDLSIFNHDN